MSYNKKLLFIHCLVLYFLVYTLFIGNVYGLPPSKQQLNSKKENISDLEDIKKRVEKLEKENDLFKINRNLTYRMLDISERNLAAPWFAITMFGITLGGVILILWRGFNRKYNKLSQQIKEEREKHIKDISENLAITCDLNAVQLFYSGKIKEAVKEGEKTIKYATGAFGDSPSREEERCFIGRLKSNLAYYYVEDKREDMKTVALKYGKLGLEIGREFMVIDMVDNFLYIFMKFGSTAEHKLKWKETYENFKPQLDAYSKLTPKDRHGYEKYYKEIKKLETKA